MKKFLLLSLFFTYLLASQLYFMPYEAPKAMHELLHSIDLAKNKIDIAIYSFTNKKIAKRLKNAAKRGVAIRILGDMEQDRKDRYSALGYLAKYKNIQVFLIKGKRAKHKEYWGKMHIKLAIIDNRRLIFGSANWSYSAFRRNYELIYFLDDIPLAKKSEKFFRRMLMQAERY